MDENLNARTESLLVDMLYAALDGTQRRNQYNLGLLTGSPFGGKYPSAEENLRTMDEMRVAYARYKGGEPEVATGPLVEAMRRAAYEVECARWAMIRGGFENDLLLERMAALRAELETEIEKRKAVV